MKRECLMQKNGLDAKVCTCSKRFINLLQISTFNIVTPYPSPHSLTVPRHSFGCLERFFVLLRVLISHFGASCSLSAEKFWVGVLVRGIQTSHDTDWRSWIAVTKALSSLSVICYRFGHTSANQMFVVDRSPKITFKFTCAGHMFPIACSTSPLVETLHFAKQNPRKSLSLHIP